jgi:hypothetical protein
MIRRILLYFEFVLLAAIQIAELASAATGVAPALGQANPIPAASETPESALNIPDTMQDFMAALPPSDSFKANEQGRFRPLDQALFYDHQGSATAHRFYTGRKRGERAMAEIMDAIVPAFTRECGVKGGRLQPRGTDIFRKTFLRLNPSGSSEFKERDLNICMRSPSQSLGALAVRSTFHLSTSLWLKDFMTHTVVILGPNIVVTQDHIDHDQADQHEADRQSSAAYARKMAEVERWRRTIIAGTETGCGPVLRVNGEMVELVYYKTREPRWYRRSELWPVRFSGDGMQPCR